ncbi:MAG: spore coat associated protein CotJA, partial [Blautia sp.]
MKGVFFMEKRHLAMATVPVQDWNTVYSQEEALLTGTI